MLYVVFCSYSYKDIVYLKNVEMDGVLSDSLAFNFAMMEDAAGVEVLMWTSLCLYEFEFSLAKNVLICC